MTIETHNWASYAHQEFHKIEADDSLAKHKAMELDNERLLKAVISQDVMNIVKKESVVDTSDLQTELEPYNDMQQKIERLQAQLGDLKGKCKDTSHVSDTQNQLSQKLENANVELEFQVSDQKDNTKNTSANTKFAKQPIGENFPIFGKTNALSKPVTSNLVSSPQEPIDVNNDKVIAPGMFRINPYKSFRNKKHVPNTVSARARTKPITVSQTHGINKKDVNSDLNGLSSIGLDNTKTRRPQPRSNTKHDRVPSASKSSQSKNKAAEIEEHHRNLLLSKNNKHISSVCNNSKIDSQDVISKVVCAMCKIVDYSESQSTSDCSNGDNACTSNAMEPKIKRFPNSTSLLDRLSRFVHGASTQTEMELELEQTQQGSSHEVSVSTEGVEELKIIKIENENVELEFQVLNYARENAHLKATYKNLFDSISTSRVDNTKTRRPQPRSNTYHDRVPSASKISRSKNKEAKVEEHHRNLLLSKNNKHISSACNNLQIDSQDPKISKTKKVGTRESLATSKPRKSRLLLRWSPTGRLFNQEGKIVDSSESKSKSDRSNGDNACTSNILEPKIKRFQNSTSLLD
nr:hypothetical protein [Tanacetum cinerariifolium]